MPGAEAGRPQAHGREAGQRLGALRQAAQVAYALGGQPLLRHAAAGRDRGEGQEARTGADEGQQQECGRQGVGRRVGQGEAEGHGGVEEEIAGDVEEGAAVGRPHQAGDGSVQPVQQAIDQDGCQGRHGPAGRQQRQRRQPDREAGQRQLVGRYPRPASRRAGPTSARCRKGWSARSSNRRPAAQVPVIGNTRQVPVPWA